MEKIRLGISRCLLGENVRYNGGNALDRFLRDTLGKHVEYVPVCPEVECGFGIPRETLRLLGDPKKPCLVTSRTGIDHTDRMEAWARRRVADLKNEKLCGFVFKSDSPSCGMERVKVYDDKGVPRKIGVGIFARIFMEHFPQTPVEEEGRLHNAILRENFIERIFTCRRYCKAMDEKKRIGSLVEFHTKNKLLLMSHSPKHLKQMGNLLGHAKEFTQQDFIMQYERLLTEGMSVKPSAAKHTNVLHHIMGYFKKNLSADEKQELLDVIDEYRGGFIPLIVPVTLVNHYVRRYKEPYLKEQTYLNPHPLEMQLRNHI
jgi:uncharacterized protein YbgA (DUF1722 family)/uncharacterized protein YbbK (DUF523 family)